MRTQSLVDRTFDISPVAWAILSLLDREPDCLPWDDKKNEYIGHVSTAPFYNGRERGFIMTVRQNWFGDALFIFFAENRNSDDIVLYHWRARSNINPPTLSDITEEAWQNACYTQSVDAAVNYIETWIKAFAAEWSNKI